MIKVYESSELVNRADWLNLFQTDAFSDSTEHASIHSNTNDSRLHAKVERKGNTSNEAVVSFEFMSRTRQCKAESGSASVFTDGINYAIVDEGQCGEPVRFAKYNQDDELLFEIKEHCHAHSQSCFSGSTKLIFIYVFEFEEIWVYRWEDGEKICALPVLPSSGLGIEMSVDNAGDFLYVKSDNDGSPEIRRYGLKHLQKRF